MCVGEFDSLLSDESSDSVKKTKTGLSSWRCIVVCMSSTLRIQIKLCSYVNKIRI